MFWQDIHLALYADCLADFSFSLQYILPDIPYLSSHLGDSTLSKQDASRDHLVSSSLNTNDQSTSMANSAEPGQSPSDVEPNIASTNNITMACVAGTPSPTDSVDNSRLAVKPDAPEFQAANAAIVERMAQREAKRKRLRELENDYDCVRKIVAHVEKHYRTSAPPAWLDLSVVAYQMSRSADRSRTSDHMAWKTLIRSSATVLKWMSGHNNWSEATQASKMPHFGTRSDIMAVKLLIGDDARLKKSFDRIFDKVQLSFLRKSGTCNPDELPEFWKGSEIENLEWRIRYMEGPPKKARARSFDDDLTDLVLSTVCQRAPTEPDNKQPATKPSEADEVEDNDNTSGEMARANLEDTVQEVEASQVRASDAGGGWETEVQNTISRITQTVNKTIATETQRLLGKRCLPEAESAQPPSKRARTLEMPSNPDNPLRTVEDGDNDRSIAPCTTTSATVITDEQSKARKENYRNLKNQVKQFSAQFKKLEDDNNKLRDEIEHVAKQCKGMRNEHQTTNQDLQRITEQCNKFEAHSKQLQGENQRLSVQLTALTDAVRKVEDQNARLSAQNGALEDENKIMRAQIVSLMARMDALEQAQPKESPTASGGHTAQEDNKGLGQEGECESTNALRHTDKGELVQSCQAVAQTGHLERATSRFPRVLDMPTFDIDWNPEAEVLQHCALSFPHQLRPAPYPHDAGIASYRSPTPRLFPDSVPLRTQKPALMPLPTTSPSHTSHTAGNVSFQSVLANDARLAPVPTNASHLATSNSQHQAQPQPHFRPHISTPTPPPTPATHTNQPTADTPLANKPHSSSYPTADDIITTTTTTTSNPSPNPTPTPTPPIESPLFQTHLPWLSTLPAARRAELLRAMWGLDRHLWAAPTREVVAHCRRRGLEDERLGELVDGFRGVLGELGVVDGAGRWGAGGDDGEDGGGGGAGGNWA